jgi:hypothetical protein
MNFWKQDKLMVQSTIFYRQMASSSAGQAATVPYSRGRPYPILLG